MSFSDDNWGRKAHRTATRGPLLVEKAPDEFLDEPLGLEEGTDGYAIFPSEYEQTEDEESIDMILAALAEEDSQAIAAGEGNERLPQWLKDIDVLRGRAVLELDQGGTVTRLLIQDGRICFGMDRSGKPVVDDSLRAVAPGLAERLDATYERRTGEGKKHLSLAVIGHDDLDRRDESIRTVLRGQLRRALLDFLTTGDVYLRDLAPGDPELADLPRHPIRFRVIEVLREALETSTSPIVEFHEQESEAMASALFRRQWNDAPRFEEVVSVNGVSRVRALESLVALARDLNQIAAIVDHESETELAYATCDELGVVYIANPDFIAINLYPVVQGPRGLAVARTALEKLK